jgi:cobalt/nickel transport system permease protein
MHISDGSLCPLTCITSFAAMIPVWIWASRKTGATLNSKYIPTLAIGSAFSFSIMMFNVPIPGGTTGHAIGATLLSLIFGPYASAMIITIALAIQALLFGDGGITCFAVNSFIIGFVSSFVGYYSYKGLTSIITNNKKNKIIASGVAGYVSILSASLITGIILGIQPILSHTANGTPLYFPYSLTISVFSIFTEHLLIFGWVEGIITALAFGLLIKEKSPLINIFKKEKALEI